MYQCVGDDEYIITYYYLSTSFYIFVNNFFAKLLIFFELFFESICDVKTFGKKSLAATYFPTLQQYHRRKRA